MEADASALLILYGFLYALVLLTGWKCGSIVKVEGYQEMDAMTG